MISSVLQRLREPFPESKDTKRSVIDILCIGAFVTLFLFLVKPFGFDRVEQGLFLECLSYGLITIIAALSYSWFCQKVLKLRTDIPSWTLGKWILVQMGSLLVVAFGNYLYMSWSSADSVQFKLEFVFFVLKVTFLVGIFPVVLSGVLVQLRSANAYRQSANDIDLKARTASSSDISLPVNASETIDLQQSDLRYIEAMQNYVSVCHVKSQDGQANSLERALIRATIASLESQFEGGDIMRCHRSYLVNLNTVENVSGNAQGLKLQLSGVPDFEVPVSRRYINELKQRLA